MVAKKEERKKENREKGKMAGRYLEANRPIYHLIFCGPKRTKEEMAFIRDLWIHPTTLCISSPCLA
jgi:hypothetical protein